MTYLTPQESQESYTKRVASWHDITKEWFRNEIAERVACHPNGGQFSYYFRDYYNIPEQELEIVLKEVEAYGWYARITNIRRSSYSTATAWIHYEISPTPFKAPKSNKFIQKIKEFFATYFCDP